jgi:hypothetical protein
MAKKRKAPADFEKQKQKVGKKKLAPVNATSTEFRARSVALPEQSQFADGGERDEPVSHRRLTVNEHLSQLGHPKADVRFEALKGLAELLTQHVEVLPPVAPSVLERSLLLFEDEYARVRKAALGVLRIAMPALEHIGALAPHEQAIRLRLLSALSHPTRAVRRDALPLLQLLLSLRPSSLVPPPTLLLPSLTDLLDSGGPSGEREAATATESATSTLEAIRALLAAQSSSTSAGMRLHVADEDRGDATRASAGMEDSTEGTGNESHEVPPTPSTSPSMRMPFVFSRWRAEPTAAGPAAALSVLGEPDASVSAGTGTSTGAVGAHPAAAARRGMWGDQLVSLPNLLMHCWLESGVTQPTDGRGNAQAALACGIAVAAVAKELLLLERSWSAAPVIGTGTGAGAGAGGDGDDGVEGRGGVGAITAALMVPLFRSVAPHMPLAAPPTAVGGSSRRAERRGETGASGVAAATYKLDAMLCELICMLLAAIPPSAASTPIRSASPNASKGRGTVTRLPSREDLASLCARLSGHMCEMLHTTSRSGGAIGVALGAREIRVFLRSASLILGSGWAAHAETAGVPGILLHRWEGAPLDDPSRHALLPILCNALLPPSPRQRGEEECAVGVAPGSLAELRGRFLRSLPKLLWQLQDTSPSLTLALHGCLLDVARASDELQTLQSALEPYFCACRRRGQPISPPLLGPFRDAPASIQRVATHVLARLQPMSATMVESLAACACMAPRCAVELVRVVSDAHDRHAIDRTTAASFLLTVCLEACDGPTEEEGGVIWSVCSHTMSRIVASAAATDSQDAGYSAVQQLVGALARACEQEKDGGEARRHRLAAGLHEVAHLAAQEHASSQHTP